VSEGRGDVSGGESISGGGVSGDGDVSISINNNGENNLKLNQQRGKKQAASTTRSSGGVLAKRAVAGGGEQQHGSMATLASSIWHGISINNEKQKAAAYLAKESSVGRRKAGDIEIWRYQQA